MLIETFKIFKGTAQDCMLELDKVGQAQQHSEEMLVIFQEKLQGFFLIFSQLLSSNAVTQEYADEIFEILTQCIKLQVKVLCESQPRFDNRYLKFLEKCYDSWEQEVFEKFKCVSFFTEKQKRTLVSMFYKGTLSYFKKPLEELSSHYNAGYQTLQTKLERATNRFSGIGRRYIFLEPDLRRLLLKGLNEHHTHEHIIPTLVCHAQHSATGRREDMLGSLRNYCHEWHKRMLFPLLENILLERKDKMSRLEALDEKENDVETMITVCSNFYQTVINTLQGEYPAHQPLVGPTIKYVILDLYYAQYCLYKYLSEEHYDLKKIYQQVHKSEWRDVLYESDLLENVISEAGSSSHCKINWIDYIHKRESQIPDNMRLIKTKNFNKLCLEWSLLIRASGNQESILIRVSQGHGSNDKFLQYSDQLGSVHDRNISSPHVCQQARKDYFPGLLGDMVLTQEEGEKAVDVLPLSFYFRDLINTYRQKWLANKDFHHGQRVFTQNLGQLQYQIWAMAERLVGPAPCDYAVMAMGSWVYGMLPYSDLDFCIIFDDPIGMDTAHEQQRAFRQAIFPYFRQLTYYAQSLIYTLAEKYGIYVQQGLRLDDADIERLLLRITLLTCKLVIDQPTKEDCKAVVERKSVLLIKRTRPQLRLSFVSDLNIESIETKIRQENGKYIDIICRSDNPQDFTFCYLSRNGDVKSYILKEKQVTDSGSKELHQKLQFLFRKRFEKLFCEKNIYEDLEAEDNFLKVFSNTFDCMKLFMCRSDVNMSFKVERIYYDIIYSSNENKKLKVLESVSFREEKHSHLYNFLNDKNQSREFSFIRAQRAGGAIIEQQEVQQNEDEYKFNEVAFFIFNRVLKEGGFIECCDEFIEKQPQHNKFFSAPEFCMCDTPQGFAAQLKEKFFEREDAEFQVGFSLLQAEPIYYQKKGSWVDKPLSLGVLEDDPLNRKLRQPSCITDYRQKIGDLFFQPGHCQWVAKKLLLQCRIDQFELRELELDRVTANAQDDCFKKTLTPLILFTKGLVLLHAQKINDAMQGRKKEIFYLKFQIASIQEMCEWLIEYKIIEKHFGVYLYLAIVILQRLRSQTMWGSDYGLHRIGKKGCFNFATPQEINEMLNFVRYFIGEPLCCAAQLCMDPTSPLAAKTPINPFVEYVLLKLRERQLMQEINLKQPDFALVWEMLLGGLWEQHKTLACKGMEYLKKLELFSWGQERIPQEGKLKVNYINQCIVDLFSSLSKDERGVFFQKIKRDLTRQLKKYCFTTS